MNHLLEIKHKNKRVVLGLLSSVESDGACSQRHVTVELGIAARPR
jgi:hypothetical protein